MNIYDISAVDMAGKEVKFSIYKKKVLIIVNTASKCGFTPQFEGLENLYKKYKSHGVEILGFPCNQFKEQDPASNKEIEEFCKSKYGVSFHMFEKIDVNGKGRHPLYKYLIENSPRKKGEDIKWNFEKFIVDSNGIIINRFSSLKKPKSLEKVLKKLI
jgi:glutathione peroxidase